MIWLSHRWEREPEAVNLEAVEEHLAELEAKWAAGDILRLASERTGRVLDKRLATERARLKKLGRDGPIRTRSGSPADAKEWTMSEPWHDWLAEGRLPSRDFYVGHVEYEDGATIEYALFGDPEWGRDTTEQLIEDWTEFVTDDLEAGDCECRHIRVAVVRTDAGTAEDRLSPGGGLIRKKPSSRFYYWHSDEECPAKTMEDFAG